MIGLMLHNIWIERLHYLILQSFNQTNPNSDN